VLYVILTIKQSREEKSKANRLNEVEPSEDSKPHVFLLQKFFRLDKVYIATSGLLCHTLPGSLIARLSSRDLTWRKTYLLPFSAFRAEAKQRCDG
jgi:16S rRNA U516 pseudouridylate synthase RsuA-like enzyme